MADLWRDFWIRETGTGQQVAQLHDGCMMMMMMMMMTMMVMMMMTTLYTESNPETVPSSVSVHEKLWPEISCYTVFRLTSTLVIDPEPAFSKQWRWTKVWIHTCGWILVYILFLSPRHGTPTGCEWKVAANTLDKWWRTNDRWCFPRLSLVEGLNPARQKLIGLYSDIKPTRCNITQFIYLWKPLYMFRVVPPSIIRSTHNCIYGIWHLSNRNCYLRLSWKRWY